MQQLGGRGKRIEESWYLYLSGHLWASGTRTWKNLANIWGQHIADFGDLFIYCCDDGKEKNLRKEHGWSFHGKKKKEKG